MKLTWSWKNPETWSGLGFQGKLSASDRKALRKRQDKISREFFKGRKAPINPNIYEPKKMPGPTQKRIQNYLDSRSGMRGGNLRKNLKNVRLPLRTGAAVGNLGVPAKVSIKKSKQKASKYANMRFAKKLMLQSMLPRFSLRMHTDSVSPLISETGKQHVFTNTSNACLFPSRDFLRQMLYKAQVDHQPWTRGTAYGLGSADNTSTIYVQNPYDHVLTGADAGPTTAVPNNTFTAAASDSDRLYQQNWNTGIIMKSFKRVYTFLNTGTMPATLTVYEYIRRDSKIEGDGLHAPAYYWARDIKSHQPMIGANHQYTANSLIARPQGTITGDATDPGSRPTKRCIELNDHWREHKISAYEIQPGQSFTHTVYVPGFYVSSRELNRHAYEAIPNKTFCMMFITQGTICYDGAAETAGIIGIGPSSLSYRYESYASFQCVPQNKSYTRYECRETDLSIDNDQNYAVTEPYLNIPQTMLIAREKHDNADKTGTADVDNALVN